MAEKNIEVIAEKSFSALINGEIITISKGARVVMPPNCDWLKAGLVKVAKATGKETADIKGIEKA